MTLAEAPMGSPVRIAGLASLGELERLRLSAMGLREETLVTKLLRTPLGDPVECLVGPQLLAIEAWLLGAIEVEPAAKQARGAAREALAVPRRAPSPTPSATARAAGAAGVP